MSPILLAVTVILIALQLILPKRWAYLPLAIAALHTSYSMQVVPSFTVARLVILVGVVRIIATGQLRWTPKNPIDLLMFLWGLVTVISTVGHEPTVIDPSPLMARLRMTVDVCGTYLYARTFIRDLDDIKRLSKAVSIIVIPLALAMLYSKFSGGQNLYSHVGGLGRAVWRDGEIRAIGPFGTPILAGTVGALIIPLLLINWRERRANVITGIICCFVMIFSTGSSTPIGAILIAAGALYLWKWRFHMKKIVRWGIVALVVADLIKHRPIWYLIALTDFTGSSTGWHRSRLIDQAIFYIEDWWFMGTNYTRHWMPYGLNEMHCDLTNYYIHLGVVAGMPLVIIMICLFWQGFKSIKPAIHHCRSNGDPDEFTFWCLGSLLFTHLLTCLTISYFDQTYIYFYFLIAYLANLRESKYAEPLENTTNETNRDKFQTKNIPSYS